MTAEADGQHLAERARHDWSLGLAPIADVAALLEETVGADVLIIRMPDHHDGFTRRNPQTGDIIVAAAATDSPERQRFTLAHELGHILADDLHDTLETVHTAGASETRAHAFARHFLAPLDGVRRLKEKHTGAELVSEVIRHFGVSPKVAGIQLGRLGLDPAGKEAAMSKSAAWYATRYGWDSERAGEVAAARMERPPRSIVAAATAAFEDGHVDDVMLARLRMNAVSVTDELLKDAGIEVVQPRVEERSFDAGDDDW